MKTKVLLELAFFIVILSGWGVARFGAFVLRVREEKKQSLSFVFTNVGLFTQKAIQVIIMFIMLFLSLIGLAWSIFTIPRLWPYISIIETLIFSLSLIPIKLYILRKYYHL